MAASLSGFAAISQTLSRSNEREQKDRITSLPLLDHPSFLFLVHLLPLSPAIRLPSPWNSFGNFPIFISACYYIKNSNLAPLSPLLLSVIKDSQPLMISAFHLICPFTFPFRVLLSFPSHQPPLQPHTRRFFFFFIFLPVSTSSTLSLHSFLSLHHLFSIFFGRKEGL